MRIEDLWGLSYITQKDLQDFYMILYTILKVLAMILKNLVTILKDPAQSYKELF